MKLILTLPWNKPSSIYDSDGPRTVGSDNNNVEFDLNGVELHVSPTEILALSTTRTRYLVEYLTCSMVLHRATTGPSHRIRTARKEYPDHPVCSDCNPPVPLSCHVQTVFDLPRIGDDIPSHMMLKRGCK